MRDYRTLYDAAWMREGEYRDNANQTMYACVLCVVKTPPFRVRILMGSRPSESRVEMSPMIFDPSNPGCTTIFYSEQ